MYFAVIALTMLVLPLGSIMIEQALRPDMPIVSLVGRWFVFWGMGVRLGLAGVRQSVQPAFTARAIFKMTGDEAFPVVRELGFANISMAVIALASVAIPTFVMPAAVAGAIFYAFAGFGHVASRERSSREILAMISDFFMSIVLVLFCAAAAILGV